jgi:hypothetical protein
MTTPPIREPATIYGAVANILLGLELGIGFAIATNVLNWLASMLHK